MNQRIVQPALFASGISLFLYAHNDKFSLGSYLSPIPFWILIGRPLGLFWNTSVLKQINKDVLPPEMKNYRELYLVSRRAIAYDVMFNHCLFNPLQAFLIAGYAYFLRKQEGIFWE